MILESIENVIEKIDGNIKSVNLDASFPKETFLETEVKKLLIIPAYVELFKSLSVETRREAEKAWASYMIKDDAVEDALDELLEKEMEFDRFLGDIDQYLLKDVETKTTNHIGSFLPQHTKVTDLNSDLIDLSSYIPTDGNLIVIFIRHFG